MTSRNEILERLHPHLRPVDRPAAWNPPPLTEALTARFSHMLSAAHGEVHHAPNWAAALTWVAERVVELGARQVVINGEEALQAVDWAGRWPNIAWHSVGRSPGDLRAVCQTADVGLSLVDAALADTGTVVIASGPGRSRLATLLPPVHIALVPTTCLLPDIFHWSAGRRDQPAWPAAVTFISGPSKTADIEQTMAIGVHGPKHFIAILTPPAG